MWHRVTSKIDGQGGKAFFSEEKKQKTFASLSRTYPENYSKYIKVFWFFFSKKNCFCFPCHDKPGAER